jgi:hypothetical protein
MKASIAVASTIVAAALGFLPLLLTKAAAAGRVPPLSSERGKLVATIHSIPLKGSKGDTWGNHKQCLSGDYGLRGQYKGLHYHSSPYHRGSPCGSTARESGGIQFGNEPKFRPKPPPRLNPSRRR